MKSFIRDNYLKGSVGEFLKDRITNSSELSVVSAYFTIYAFAKLKPQLKSIKEMRFLFGEPVSVKKLDPSTSNKRDYRIEDDNLVISLESRLQQKQIARECAEWIKEKVEIKSMEKSNLLHGKLYHIKHSNASSDAIMGSSNFTTNGLGLNKKSNIELNMEIDSKQGVEDLLNWFNELWNNPDQTFIRDVKEDVLKYLEVLYDEHSPEFIYFKTLFHLFENSLSEENENILKDQPGFLESEIWKTLYDFQKDGVKGAINKILKHNGCILADSVGLGKTLEALAVIKYFELKNYRVLVLCPKKLSENWTMYQSLQNDKTNPFLSDKFGYAVMYHTDMGRTQGKSLANSLDFETINWGNYDLIVIDESHNFRGNPKVKVNDNNEVKLNRSQWLLNKIIQEGVKTKVLLLSATPVNNNLRDLRNQINLIAAGNNEALSNSAGVKDIAQTLVNAQTQFTIWSALPSDQRTVKNLLERLDAVFFRLLDELTIARSRNHIKKFYDISKIGKFPDRLPVDPEYPQIDLKGNFPSYEDVDNEIEKYSLSLYNPSKYVKKDFLAKYGIKTDEEKAKEKAERKSKKGKKSEPDFDQAEREHYLIGMMKVNFLKRLESSIESFKLSMNRTIEKIDNLIKKLDEFEKFKKANPDYEINFDDLNDDESEDNELWSVGKKLKYDLIDLDLKQWNKDLKKDKAALLNLYNAAVLVKPADDAKLDLLKTCIERKLNKPYNEGNKKVLIFTAFSDTASYIYENLKDWAIKKKKLNIAYVGGSETKTTFGDNRFSAILTNFSPISKKRKNLPQMPQDDEIDILIGTDCISEGQNLQDCDLVINYDIHWNPVRIIQRFGRIDRLGSINEKIKMINFWPTADLDNYINLKTRVESRMALVDVAATAEDNVLASDQIEELISEDLKYRDAQLKKLKDEVIDLEDVNSSVNLSDFSFDDFRIDLRNFLQQDKNDLADAPLGLYALVPSPVGTHKSLLSDTELKRAENEDMKPGVIFCLRHKQQFTGDLSINRLDPYYLIYLQSDGTVKYNFSNSKQILEIYRLLCQGKKSPYLHLKEMFDLETKNGSNMDEYSGLIQKAITQITQVFKTKNLQKLTSGRGGEITSALKLASTTEDFELITWLIIK